MDYLLELLELKKEIKSKDNEIKDFQKRIKILLEQVKEKNEHIKHLEVILNTQNKYKSSSNKIIFLNSSKEHTMNTNENDNNYIIKSDSSAKSNEKYKKLYMAYEKLKKDFDFYKSENMILYENTNGLTKQKNDVYKLLQQKEKEFSKLVLEKNSLEKEIENLKEINNKLKTENNENKNKFVSKENSNDIKNDINDNEEKNNFQKKNEILEMEKKTLEKKIEELQLELNKIKNNNENILKHNEEETTKKNNENLIKELNEKINKQKEEIEELGNNSRDSELKYLTKIESLQDSINNIKRNYLFLEKKNEIQFSMLNTKEKI